MANPKNRSDDNVPGPWYVDNECICCGLCENLVPEIFEISGDYTHHRVHRQPVTPEETAAAVEARERCPVEAIGQEPGHISIG